MAWIVALVELFGALFVLVGFCTRIAAALVAMNMFTALALVHWPLGYAQDGTSIELTALMVAVGIALAVRGPGRLSIEHGLLGYNQSLGMKAVSRLS